MNEGTNERIDGQVEKQMTIQINKVIDTYIEINKISTCGPMQNTFGNNCEKNK